jgi:hypothetical protein
MISTFGVITSGKFHATRCADIENTWGKNLEGLYFLTDTAYKKNYLTVSDKPDRASVYLKMMNGLVKMHDLRPSDWYIICDDDTFIFVKSFLEFLHIQNADDPVVVCRPGCYPDVSGIIYPGGGAGMAVSRSALSKIYEKLRTGNYIPYQWSDVTFGYIMKDSGLKAVEDGRLNPQTPAYFRIPVNAEIGKYFSFHYVSHELAYELYKFAP